MPMKVSGLLVQHPSLRLAMEDFRGAWGGETFVCLLHGCMLVNSHPAYGLSTRRSRVCRMSKLDLRFRAFRGEVLSSTFQDAGEPHKANMQTPLAPHDTKTEYTTSFPKSCNQLSNYDKP